MRILVGIGQVMLSLSFVWAGCMKLFQSTEKLGEMWPWTSENPKLVLVTGIADLVVGIGVLLPFLLRIRPQLSVYACYAAILQMIAAAAFHIFRGEVGQIGVNVFFALLAMFIIWGEWRK